jgi:S-DNA-T family DNA segregation ATPase FtsK/SpoIIIE
MAKPKRGRPPKNKKATKKDQAEQEEGLKRSVLKEILAIILITIGVFIILALIGVAGNLGKWVTDAIKFVIGQSIYVLPLALFGISFMLFAQERYPLKTHNVVGVISFFICFSTILQALLGPSVSFDIATVGNYGGVIGWGIYALVSPILNRWVLVFIFAMLTIVSVIVAANARLKQIIAKLFSPMRKKGEDEEAGDDFKINQLPIKGTIGNDKPKDEDKEPAGPIVASFDKDWKYPSVNLLEATTTQPDPGNAKANGATIKSVFSDFGYEVDMKGVDVGPTVSQYTLKPPTGVNLSKFNSLDKNLALALEAEQVRIEAPIPGKSLVGIEVPNKKGSVVRLKDIISSDEVKDQKSKLTFVLGRDVNGKIVTGDLATAPHLLIAGATGTGKSVMINTLLVSLLYRNSPSELKLILVDPKRVELSLYDGIPHLLSPVVFEPDKTISALKWAVAEMERRLKLLQENGVRDIGEFNKQKGVDKMPFIVIVIDELFDLMMAAGKDVEALIQRISQMARAVGIHLVLATQRPSVNVITGTIKANVPTRIALTTSQQVDSRTIIDASGAEKLLGKGDMLFASPSFIKPKRVQGVFVSNEEVTKVGKFLKEQREPQYNEEVLAQAVKIKGMPSLSGDGGGEDDDEMFDSAAEAVVREGKASATLLQRRLRVGYARAARLIDLLEDRGVIGPADGSRPRKVLVQDVSELSGGNSESE